MQEKGCPPQHGQCSCQQPAPLCCPQQAGSLPQAGPHVRAMARHGAAQLPGGGAHPHSSVRLWRGAGIGDGQVWATRLGSWAVLLHSSKQAQPELHPQAGQGLPQPCRGHGLPAASCHRHCWGCHRPAGARRDHHSAASCCWGPGCTALHTLLPCSRGNRAKRRRGRLFGAARASISSAGVPPGDAMRQKRSPAVPRSRV